MAGVSKTTGIGRLTSGQAGNILMTGTANDTLDLFGGWGVLHRRFFPDFGTESVEAALRFARSARGRTRILYYHHAFHRSGP
jgi:4-aminobutyrate aminotransferase-like enzyme